MARRVVTVALIVEAGDEDTADLMAHYEAETSIISGISPEFGVQHYEVISCKSLGDWLTDASIVAAFRPDQMALEF